jgi:Ser/Thr protein kinase RdoA (MazF antagonist)
MMRLSTMFKVDSTINADRSSPVAEEILESWVYDRGSVRFFRSSANFVYRFRDQDRTRFLRFAEASERRREFIDTEVAILETVAAAGIVVATPVPSKRGNAVETVETEWGTFHAVVFHALEGQQHELDELVDSGFHQWGAALGRLHAAMSARMLMPGRPTWSDHMAFVREYLPADSTGLQAEFADIAMIASALPATEEASGLIHGDFELDNLVWHGADIGILDFDDCSRLWYAADVAFALRDLLEVGADASDRRFRAFSEGYRAFHPLSEESESHLPFFLRYANLLSYARIARAMDLTAGADHPEWLLRLSSKLLNRMAAYRASVESRRD